MKKKSKKREKSMQDVYKAAWDFYAEQLRRYCKARPDWDTVPAEKGAKDFWGNYGNW